MDQEKETKRQAERCRALAQRIVRELTPASIQVLGGSGALAEALEKTGAQLLPENAELGTAALLVVEDPEWVDLPALQCAQVLLVCTDASAMADCAKQLAAQGLYRDFEWKNRGKAQQTALFCRSAAVQDAQQLLAGYEMTLDDLREHLDELDRGKPVYVNCQTGLRSYLACRLLTQYGFTCSHLSGGYSFYQVVTQERQTARSAYPCGMEKLTH